MHDKAFNIAKNLKYGGYQGDLASMTHKFFDKKTSGGTVKNENISNQELAGELHKPIIKKIKTRKVQLLFIDNIWSADIANIQLICKFDKRIRFLLCVVHIFSTYS